MKTLHAGLSNQEETETSTDIELAILAVAVAQVTISGAECAIVSSQNNATRGVDHPQSIAQRRLCLSEFRIVSARKCPALSTNDSDQTVSQSKEIYNGSVVFLPSHILAHFRKTKKDTSKYW